MSETKIELLVKENCIACQRVRYFLQILGLKWKERSVDDRAVPVLKIDGKTLRPPISFAAIQRAVRNAHLD